MTIGGFDSSKFGKEGKEVNWIDIDTSNTNYWSLPMTATEVTLKNTSIPIQSTNVLLDSGLSYALIPSKDVTAIAEAIEKISGVNCKPDNYEIEQHG